MQLTHATQVQTETIDGHTISYILKPNRKDINHLVILLIVLDYKAGTLLILLILSNVMYL